MASFAQQQPIKFAEYTPKYNTSLYSQVGQFKQGKYNEGLQQAQSYIQNIAGLEVGPQVDKQYLQQKLEEVTSKANDLGGQDFSDQTIVGRIGTYAATVANDPTVINSISATAQYKKENALRDSFRKEGKDDPANSYFFDKQAAQWLNSTTPGASFTGKYIPYRDVNKKVMEAIKAVDPDSGLTQMPYQTDANGNFITDKVTGQPLLNTAIIEKYYKGKSKEKVLAAIEGSLDAGDYQQLSMTGAYKMQGLTPEQMASSVNEVYTSANKQLSDRQQALNIEYLSESDGTRKAEIKKELANIEQNLTTIAQKHTSDLSSIETNPDGVRSNIYMQGWKNNLVNGFTSTETWTKYMDNPLYKAQWEQEKYANENTKWDADYALKVAKEQREQAQFSLEAMGMWNPSGNKGKGKGTGPNGVTLGTKIDAPINTNTDPLHYENLLLEDQTAAIDKRKTLNKDFAITALQATPWGQGKSVDEIERGAAMAAQRDGEDVSEFYNKWAHKFTETYKSDKTKIPYVYRDKFKQLDELDREIQDNHLILTEADKKFGVPVEKLLGNLPANSTVYTELKNGELGGAVNLSRKDMADLGIVWANRNKNSTALIGNLGGTNSFGMTHNKDLENLGEAAKKRFIQKYGDKTFNHIMTYVNEAAGGTSMSPAKTIARIANRSLERESGKSLDPQGIYNIIAHGIAPLVDDKTVGAVAKRSEWFRNNSRIAQPYTQPIYRPNGEGKDEVNSKLMILAERMGDNNTNPNFDREDFKKAITEDNSRIALQVVPPAGNSGEYKYELQVLREDGTTRKMDITQQDATMITGEQYNYNTNPVVKRIQYNTGNKGAHTNYNYSPLSDDAWKSPYYGQDKFNTQKYIVSADVMRKSNEDYSVILHVKEKGTEDFVNIPIPTNFTPNQIEAAIAAVSDGFIDNLKKDPNAR